MPQSSLAKISDRFRVALAASNRHATVADVARAAGVKPGTLNQQLGRDSIPADAAKVYARVLGVRVDWFMFGDGAMTDAASEAAAEIAAAPVPSDPIARASLIVDELAEVAPLTPQQKARLMGRIHRIITIEDLSKV